MVNIKKLDNRLNVKKNLDWSVSVSIKSRFFKWTDYDIIKIKNQFLWSRRFLYSLLCEMDSRKSNVLENVVKENLEIRNKKTDKRLHTEVAKFLQEWEKIII